VGDFAATKTDDDYRFALPKLPDTRGDGCCGKWQGCTNESEGCLFKDKKLKMKEAFDAESSSTSRD
jgi:hypothetical protein